LALVLLAPSAAAGAGPKSVWEDPRCE
jgi:hypothetical protein